LAPVIAASARYAELRGRGGDGALEFVEQLSELVLDSLDGDEAVLDPARLANLATAAASADFPVLDTTVERDVDGRELLLLAEQPFLPLVLVGDFAPRIIVDGVLVQRARWWFARSEVVTEYNANPHGANPHGVNPHGVDPSAAFLVLQRLRGCLRLPRHCFARSSNGSASIQVDLDAVADVDALVDLLVVDGGDLFLTEVRPVPSAPQLMVAGFPIGGGRSMLLRA
jgi:hypothetical protein